MKSLLSIMGLAAFSVACWLLYPSGEVTPSQPVAEEDSSRVIPVNAPPVQRVEARPTVAPDRTRAVSDLEGLHEKNMTFVNKVLRRAGRDQIPPGARVANDALNQLADMVSATNRAINEASDAVLAFQRPFAKRMAAEVKAAVDAGKTVKYAVLPGGVLPDPKPYELFVTTAYQGVVYLLTIPVSAELMEVVDGQRMAEALRLDAFVGFAAELR